jgi:predicted site-specific integrase-resolvase
MKYHLLITRKGQAEGATVEVEAEYTNVEDVVTDILSVVNVFGNGSRASTAQRLATVSSSKILSQIKDLDPSSKIIIHGGREVEEGIPEGLVRDPGALFSVACCRAWGDRREDAAREARRNRE